MAAGSATWWALSTQHSASTPQINTPQPVRIVTADSLRKKKDSTAITSRVATHQKQAQAPAAETKSFVPTERDLPTPSGPLETHVKDSALMHLKVK
jgi:hypothetical protein